MMMHLSGAEEGGGGGSGGVKGGGGGGLRSRDGGKTKDKMKKN